MLLPFRLKPLDEALHGDLHHVRLAVASGGSLSVLHPPLGGKVCRLRYVEARVEARVVAHRERDHDFALLLDDLEIKKKQKKKTGFLKFTGFLF